MILDREEQSVEVQALPANVLLHSLVQIVKLDCFLNLEILHRLLHKHLIPKVVGLLPLAKDQVEHVHEEHQRLLGHIPRRHLANIVLDFLLSLLQ